MDAWDLHEARLIQEQYANSAVAGLSVTSARVPAGKVWTIVRASCAPDADETQLYAWRIAAASGTGFTITYPQQLALTPDLGIPLVTEGWEMKLYPGEAIQCMRDAATAGSTMVMRYAYIETDLPFYAYSEPLKPVVDTHRAHGSVYRATGGISTGGAPGARPGPITRGGSGGRSEPV